MSQFFTCTQVMLYQGIILFEQYNALHFDPDKFATHALQVCAFWIYVEITAFYMYIASAVLYLFSVQVKGIFGLTKRRSVAERYKYDALEFYDEDINWFAFSFVMLGLNLHMLDFLVRAHANEVKFVDESGLQIND